MAQPWDKYTKGRPFDELPFNERLKFWENYGREIGRAIYQYRLMQEQQRQQAMLSSSGLEGLDTKTIRDLVESMARQERKKKDKEREEKYTLSRDNRIKMLKLKQLNGYDAVKERREEGRSFLEKALGLDKYGDQGFLESAIEALDKFTGARGMRNVIDDYFDQRIKHKRKLTPEEEKEIEQRVRTTYSPSTDALGTSTRIEAQKSEAQFDYGPLDYLLSGRWWGKFWEGQSKATRDAVSGVDLARKSMGAREFDKQSEAEKFIQGLIYEIGADPTLLFGGLIRGTVKKGAEAALKGGAKVAPKATNKVISGLEKVGQAKKATKEAVKNAPGIRQARQAFHRLFGPHGALLFDLAGRENMAAVEALRDARGQAALLKRLALEDAARAANELSGVTRGAERTGYLMEHSFPNVPEIPLGETLRGGALVSDDVVRQLINMPSEFAQSMRLDEVRANPWTRPGIRAERIRPRTYRSGLGETPLDPLKEAEWIRKGFLPPLAHANRELFLGPYGTWKYSDYDYKAFAREMENLVNKDVPLHQIADTIRRHPAVERAAEILKNRNSAFRQWAEEMGYDLDKIENYMAHVLTDEARQFVGKRLDKVGDGSAVLKRTVQGPVWRANQVLREKTGVNEWFNPDALVSTVEGQSRLADYISYESFVRNVLNNPDFAYKITPGAKIPKQLNDSSKFERIKAKDFQVDEFGMISKIEDAEYIVPKGFKRVLMKQREALTDEGIKQVTKVWDKLMRIWKRQALFSAGFHIRNMLGNFWNQYLEMRPDQVVYYNMKALAKLDDVQKAFRKDPSKWTPAEKAAMEDYQEFVRLGLQGSNIYEVEFSRQARTWDFKDAIQERQKGLIGRALHPLARIGQKGTPLTERIKAPFEASRKVGDSIDEFQRFATFLYAKQAKKMDSKQAADLVRALHFDYQEISPFEQDVMRRFVAPFYTWSRKNIPFQLYKLATRPGKFARLGQVQRTGQETSGQDWEIIPQWMKEAFGIPFGDEIFITGLPATDINKNLGQIAEESLNPFFKAIASGMANQNLMTGERFEGDKVPVFGGLFQMSDKAKHLTVDQITPLRNLDKAMNAFFNPNKDNPNIPEEKKKEQGKYEGDIGEAIKLLLGAELDKDYEPTKFKRAYNAEWREWLDNKIKQFKSEGKHVPTIKELQEKGVIYGSAFSSKDEAFKKAKKVIQKHRPDEVDFLLDVKNRVYNQGPDYALRIAIAMKQMGYEDQVIKAVTSDYLDVEKFLKEMGLTLEDIYNMPYERNQRDIREQILQSLLPSSNLPMPGPGLPGLPRLP